jgi:hypothetical protein
MQLWPSGQIGARETLTFNRTMQLLTLTTTISKSERLWASALPVNGGWRFALVRQPTNSPDTNVLDLAQFRALQAIQ